MELMEDGNHFMPPATGGLTTTGTPEILTIEDPEAELELDIMEVNMMATGSPKREKAKNRSLDNPQAKCSELAEGIEEHLDKSCKFQKTPDPVLCTSEEDLQLTKDLTLQQSYNFTM